MKTLKHIIFPGLALVAALVSCKKETAPVSVPEEKAPQVYALSVDATKGADVKALSLDGRTLNAAWAVGEQVTVYNVTRSAALGGYLEAQSTGASTTLKGSLTGTVEADDKLSLSFLNPVYSAQNGTLAYIAANCDYAEATVTVSSVSGSDITANDAAFANRQAIVKFWLKDTDGNALNASSLTIAAASNQLLKGQFHNTPETKHTGYTYDGGSGGYDAPSGLVDGSTDSKWCAGGEHKSNGVWYCEFHTASAVQVDGYTLTTGNDNSSYTGRNPKDWVLKAKVNSGDAWTTIATVANESTMEDINYEPYDFIVDNPGTYQYFRIEISSDRGAGTMQLSELQLWKASDATTSVYGPITITPASATNELTVALHNANGADTYTLTANVGGQTYPYVKSGVNFVDGKYYEITVKMPKLYPFSDITVLGGQQGSDAGSESYDKLFDGNKSTKWCSFKNHAGSYANRCSSYQDNVKDQIIWKTASSVVLAYYILNTGGDTGSYPGRNWKSWTIYGANFANDSEATIDATGWNEIQKVENDNVLQAANNADCLYAILDNKTSYQYYRLVIEDIKSTDDNLQQMSLMTLFTK